MSGVSIEAGLLRLAGYAREHGHANPPVRTVWLDWKIGIWVRKLRKKKRLGLLTATQVQQAERLGIDWEPPSGRQRTASPRPNRQQRREALLHASLDRLIPYWQDRSDINVLQVVGIADWPQAGRFVCRLRTLRRQGTLPTTVEERAAAMGIDWNPRPGRRRS